MFALIRKDLIACRLFLLIGLAVYVLYGISAFQQPLLFFIMNIGVAILLVLLPIVVDDKYRRRQCLNKLVQPQSANNQEGCDQQADTDVSLQNSSQ